MYTISELAKEFDLTTRTLRYYEELGMLRPKRTETGKRVYGKKEHAQLKIIMRGKKYGFSLVEIKDIVLLFDKDRTGIKQLEKTIDTAGQKLNEINERIKELDELKQDFEQVIKGFTETLHSLKSKQ
ncbi:MerR family DNA-binding transcriptional regulator [Peribacillus butanolivorans]|jgi:DNA-binding transcriptional MerR regulator|uniref:MerR family DNA-binding transcriptional regulator n=1 Tax=Peribacillus butanolivorans TaxID=421767 RepID=A0AAX0RSY4_9BACI|nr:MULTISPECIES: MerR family DNA-binding transcriptional regulator [Peribacillus]KRF63316.1 MerR family transcriptional regulator [Bacillus sp. Soil768D1]AXN39571.1 MerR family DNA-binding transcriptional regulator [Peribacillus butanolivorans]KON67654.1 MerR family transcriptional regulator [Peribacillus butanolivorans]MBK5444893.1 MerR family DNA-binding transcriptional regulator [Peribacillus sp. TH24]MBK5460387.1 MerR family DNA-binding transcriptional regulator [Peribacillus sp. TH27]